MGRGVFRHCGMRGHHEFCANRICDLHRRAQFVPVTPCRVADTRNANGAFGGTVPARRHNSGIYRFQQRL